MKTWNISGQLRRFLPSSFQWHLPLMHSRTLYRVRTIYFHKSNFVFSLPIHHFLSIDQSRIDRGIFLDFLPSWFSLYHNVSLINEKIEIIGLNEIHDCCFQVILNLGLRADVDKAVYNSDTVIFKVKLLWKWS